MKKLLIIFAAVIVLFSGGHEAKALTFLTGTSNYCSRFLDATASTFPSGPFSYIVSNGSTLVWSPINNVDTYRIYKTPQGGSESLIATIDFSATNLDNNSNGFYQEARGFFVSPANYHVFRDEITNTLQNATYRVEALNSSNNVIDSGTTGSFGSTCSSLSSEDIDRWNTSEINASNINANAPGNVNSTVDLTRDYYSWKRNFDLSVESIKNSSGVEILDTPGGILSSSISFSPIRVAEDGDDSGLSLNIPSTLPTGVYTVTVVGTGLRLGGMCSSSISEPENEGSGPQNWKTEITCHGDFMDDYLEIVTSAPSWSAGNQIVNTARNNFMNDYCGAGNYVSGQGSGGLLTCTNPQPLAKIYTTFTLTYNGVEEPYDYKIEAVGNKRITPSSSEVANIGLTKLLGDSQSITLDVSKVLNSSFTNVLNTANGITANAGSFSPNPSTPNPASISNLTVTAGANIPTGTYTVFVTGLANRSIGSQFTASGLAGSCTGSHINTGTGYDGVSGSNMLECNLNGVRTVSRILNNGFGVSAWNSTSATDANSQFTAYVNSVCGAGNWTSTTAPHSFSTNNTTETFSCASVPNPPPTTLELTRTTAYQLRVDDFNLVIADDFSPSQNCNPASASMRLSWNLVPGMASYKVYRSVGNGSATLLTTVPQPSVATTTVYHTDSPLQTSTGYTYYVVGTDTNGVDTAPSVSKSRVTQNSLDIQDDCDPSESDPLSTNCVLVQPVLAQSKPRWRVTASKGDRPYTFNWPNTGTVSPDPNNTAIQTFTSNQTLRAGNSIPGPVMTVIDDGGDTESPTCRDANLPGAKLNLLLSNKTIDMVTNKGKDHLIVQRGSLALTYIDFSGIDQLSCTYSPDLISRSGVSTGMDISFLKGPLNNGKDLDTSIVGTYIFTVNCRKTSDNQFFNQPARAILEVVNSPVFEEF